MGDDPYLYTNGYPDRSAAGAAGGAAIGPVFLSTEWDRDRNDDVDFPPPEHYDFEGTFHRERVAWINCLPDEGHQGLAIAYIAVGLFIPRGFVLVLMLTIWLNVISAVTSPEFRVTTPRLSSPSSLHVMIRGKSTAPN